MSERRAGDERIDRRRFLYQLGIAGVGGVFTLLAAVPLVGYFFSVLFRRPAEQWVKVCSLDQIDTVEPRLFRVAFPGEDANVPYQVVKGVFVIRRGLELLAFSNVCTHMGCSVRWLDWRQQILCPCHGGMYDRWGELAGGPPAASLPYYLSRVEGNDLFIANRIIRRGVPEGV